jgi:endonuclease YncB( thermonuclease family)
MAPDTDSGAQPQSSECPRWSSVYSFRGGLKGLSAGKFVAKSEGTEGAVTAGAFWSGFLSLLVISLVALDVGSGLSAEGGAAPTAPSAASEPARAVPSAPDASQAGALPAPAAPASPPAAKMPAIVEWLNQTVRLRDNVQALDRPSSDGQAAGRIRGGAEVKAIGIVAGGAWLQIELPGQKLAYIPIGAVELNGNPAAGSPGQAAEPTAATQPSATSPEATSAPAIVRGPVIRVPNAATLVVADQRIRLSGIDPGPSTVLAPFENWVRAQGALQCEPDAQTGRYRCFTANGVDVAEAAILNGAGRVGDGATSGYRERETEARQGKRGLWQGP